MFGCSPEDSAGIHERSHHLNVKSFLPATPTHNQASANILTLTKTQRFCEFFVVIKRLYISVSRYFIPDTNTNDTM